MADITIGVLALQGDFAKHVEVLKSLGIQVKEVRKPEDLEECNGLIIPGGESTVMLRQLNFIKMKKTLCEFAKQKPVFGTCAGLIVMSKTVQSYPMETLGLLDLTVERNAFGRQIESFQAPIELYLSPNHPNFFRAFFIRAPRIRNYGSQINILASYQNEPVLIRQGHHLGASFHPELTSDPIIHEYFLNLVHKNQSS
jgi:5'-phosphate synthase pdxT subunit